MKKKLTVFAVTIALMTLFTVVAFAEGEADPGAGTEPLWNLWSLLDPSNLNLGRLIAILISTISTVVRVIGGAGGFKNMLSVLWNAVKNAIPRA